MTLLRSRLAKERHSKRPQLYQYFKTDASIFESAGSLIRLNKWDTQISERRCRAFSLVDAN